jgi:hypothetical protein
MHNNGARQRSLTTSSSASTARRRAAGSRPTQAQARDILLRLQLELEDANQSLALLRQATDREEAQLRDDGDGEESRWRDDVAVKEADHKAAAEEALERVDKLLKTKQELSGEAKQLLDQVG